MNDSTPKKTTQPINAYFSHSYRADDREVNLAFWKLFSKEDFFFTIDPQSDTFIIPHLERLMRYSDCFIGVVTHRIKETSKVGNIILKEPRKYLTYSPYIAFEAFLGELAEKPRLLFVENDLDFSIFGGDDCVHPFDRTTLFTKVNQYEDIVHNFARRVRSYISYYEQITNSQYTRKAGILIESSQDPNGYSQELISTIQDTLKLGGYKAEVIQPQINNGLKEIIRKLSELELIIIDVLDPQTPMDLLAVIQAKSIPCIRIASHASSDSIEILKSKGLLKDYFVGEDVPIIVWNDSEELIKGLLLCLSKFTQARTPFITFEEGRKYFISAGRKKHKVFISNPGSLNPLALELVKELQTLNIQYFQYMSSSSIEIGTIWEKELEKELTEFNIFVALINDDYHKSLYCQKELETAVERFNKDGVTILAYLCEETQYPKIIKDLLQGKDIHAYPKDEEKVKTITEQIEKELLKDETKKKEINVKEKISVFLNHASEDKPLVKKLYNDLKKVPWLDPWLDEEKLLPGSDWAYEIDQAIKNADAVIICVSEISSSKIGVVQEEIRKAEEMQRRRPHGYIYMIPVLLEKCKVPANLDQYHWVDITEPGKIDLIIKSLEGLRTPK
jgi:hypothetical protein